MVSLLLRRHGGALAFFIVLTVLLRNETLAVFSTLQGCNMETCRANIIIFAWNHVHLLWTLAKILPHVRWGSWGSVKNKQTFTSPDFLTHSLTCFSPQHYVHWQGGHCWFRKVGEKVMLIRAGMLLTVTGLRCLCQRSLGIPNIHFPAPLWSPRSLPKFFLHSRSSSPSSFWTFSFSLKPHLLFINPAFFGHFFPWKPRPCFPQIWSLCAEAQCVIILLTCGSASFLFYEWEELEHAILFSLGVIKGCD